MLQRSGIPLTSRRIGSLSHRPGATLGIVGMDGSAVARAWHEDVVREAERLAQINRSAGCVARHGVALDMPASRLPGAHRRERPDPFGPQHRDRPGA